MFNDLSINTTTENVTTIKERQKRIDRIEMRLESVNYCYSINYKLKSLAFDLGDAPNFCTSI